VQIVSVFRHAGMAESASLNFEQPLYVYDIKKRKDLGRQQTVSLSITPYRAMFYAISPQPLKPVQLNVAVSKVAPGSVQQAVVKSALPEGSQAVKVWVTMPDGKPADWADTVVVTGGQGATVDVPVAYNDPKGAWTVHATELYTGVTTTATFSVE